MQKLEYWSSHVLSRSRRGQSQNKCLTYQLQCILLLYFSLKETLQPLAQSIPSNHPKRNINANEASSYHALQFRMKLISRNLVQVQEMNITPKMPEDEVLGILQEGPCQHPSSHPVYRRKGIRGVWLTQWSNR